MIDNRYTNFTSTCVMCGTTVQTIAHIEQPHARRVVCK